MIKILSSQQIREVENMANEGGITFLRLMENAGSACAKVIRNKFDDTGLRRVLIVCGKGKNGGDGYVIARKLSENGYKVTVLLTMGEPVADTAREMLERIKNSGVQIENYCDNDEKYDLLIQDSDIIVDCVFGTGFSGVPDERLQRLFKKMSESNGYVVSIDLPSGMCADSSELLAPCVKADMTISVIALKYSLVYYPSAEFAGEIQVVSIGIPEDILRSFSGGYTLNINDIKSKMPKRSELSNKGDFGKALIIAGSYEMPGAALLSSQSASECGAGIVKLAFPDKAYPVMMNTCPEKVLFPLPSNKFGRISALCEARIKSELKNCSAVLIGCGLGNDYDTKQVVTSVLENSEVPIVLDADGINSMCESIDIIKNAKAKVIITPHPGEAARLLGCTVKEVQADRIGACRDLVELTGATVVLKGSRTVVSSNGEDFYINTTGNSGLATAGSGDVLAGIIVSLICQKINPDLSAVMGTFIHGYAGDIATEKYSKMGMTAQKIITELPKTLSAFEKG